MKKALFLAAILASVTWNFASSPNQNTPEHQGNIEKDEPSAMTTSVVNNYQCTKPTEGTPEKPSHWYASPEWALVFVGVVTCFVIGLQAIETRRATSEMGVGNSLAKRGMEITANKERPHISIRPLTLMIGSGNPYEVKYAIRYSCPTPASIVDAKADAYLHEFPGKLPAFPMSIPRRVDTSRADQEQQPITGFVDDSVVKNIKSGSQHLFFCGVIEYRGVHLTDKDPPYRTAFKYQWIAFDDIPGDPGVWRPVGEERDNQET